MSAASTVAVFTVSRFINVAERRALSLRQPDGCL